MSGVENVLNCVVFHINTCRFISEAVTVLRIATTLSHRVEWCVESNTSVCVDGVAGSSLQSMVDAVDNAGVLLVCISRKFKDSPRCRTGQEMKS